VSFRQVVLAALANIRPILGPTGLDIRVTAVTVRTRTWTGGRRGLGSAVDVDLPIVPRPRVRKATLREVASSGGRISIDDVIVDHVQPAVNGVGFTRAQIAPEPTTDGVEIIYVLVGEDNQGFNGNFYRKWATSDRPFRHTLILTRGETTPGNL
jgi:hypothetical protein